MKIPLLIATLLVAPICRADALFTTVTSVDQDGKLQPMMTVTSALKDGLERLDSAQGEGFFRPSETTIINRAKGEEITLDYNLKIYVVQPLRNSAGIGNKTTVKESPRAGGGSVVLTLGAKFLGSEKLMNYSVRRYSTSMTIESSGCCGTGKSQVNSEVWMADVKLPLPATDAATSSQSAWSQQEPGCQVQVQRRGDVAGYDAAQAGLALKTVTSDETGKTIMVSQVTALSLAPLGDDKFAVPNGFKKVSRAAYDAARLQAIMESIRESRKN